MRVEPAEEVDISDEIKLRESKCLIASVVITEALMLFFGLTILDALAAFGTIYPDFCYYVFKIVVTSITSLLLVGGFF